MATEDNNQVEETVKLEVEHNADAIDPNVEVAFIDELKEYSQDYYLYAGCVA